MNRETVASFFWLLGRLAAGLAGLAAALALSSLFPLAGCTLSAKSEPVQTFAPQPRAAAPASQPAGGDDQTTAIQGTGNIAPITHATGIAGNATGAGFWSEFGPGAVAVVLSSNFQLFALTVILAWLSHCRERYRITARAKP